MTSAHARADRPPPRLKGVRLLVVEDDADLREAMEIGLEMEGADVTTAGSGHAGMRAFAHGRTDVVVSDLWMRDGNGYELIERIRRLPPEVGGLTPAIAVSAAENMRSAIAAGFHVFMAKPFDLFDLVDVVVELTKTDGAQATAPWTISSLAPGRLLVTLVGRIETGDVRTLVAELARRLGERPFEIVADLRAMTRYTPAAGSLAERALWAHRARIRGARIVGGSFGARVVSAAVCKVLGVPVTFCDDIEDGTRADRE
jgi:CheY-like chemotaxis protein